MKVGIEETAYILLNFWDAALYGVLDGVLFWAFPVELLL